MNERIRKLLKEVGGINYGDDNEELTPMLVGKQLEKFAELIVTECVTLVRDMGNPTYINHSDWRVSRNDAMRVIREHFGVAE